MKIATILITAFSLLTTIPCLDAAVTKGHKAWSAALLEENCRDITSTRICNPDEVLSMNDANAISKRIYNLESKHPITEKCHMEDGIKEHSYDVQMAVVLVNNIKLDVQTDYSDNYVISNAKNIATNLHNTWGVGNVDTRCDGSISSSGILLLASVLDRTIYISTSTGIQDILTSHRIDHIIDGMKPFLRKEDYKQAILKSIDLISDYIDRGPPSFYERNISGIIISVCILAFGGLFLRDNRKSRQYDAVRSQLSQIDKNRAMALRGKYECTSCPICLEDFQNITDLNGDANEDILGSDGKPIQLLRCGHAFDKTCWDEWISKHTRNTHQCPICKEDIRVSQSPTRSESQEQSRPLSPTFLQTQTQTDRTVRNRFNRDLTFSRNSSYQRYQRLYQDDRDFRLGSLRRLHPLYIRQSQVDRWSRDNYEGSLAEDTEFIRMNPRNGSSSSGNSSSSSSNNSGFNSFGGGKSGGGGGGTW